MVFRQITPRKILGLFFAVLSALFSVKILSCQNDLVSMLSKNLTKKQVENMACKGSRFEVGSLVLVTQSIDQWNFGIIKAHAADGSYQIRICNKNSLVQVPVRFIKSLAPFWQLLFQSTINQTKLVNLIDEQINYVHRQGIPEGHGCILPARSNVIVLSDPHGNVQGLRRQLIELYNKGLIDNNCTLKSDCYLVFMVPHIENIENNKDIIYVFLSIARHNKGRIFMLGKDQDIASLTTSTNVSDLDHKNLDTDTNRDSIAMSKLIALWKILPKMVLMGLQTPSTHSYDFIMLCREKDYCAQEHKKFLDDVVDGHIASHYKNHYAISYKAKHKHNSKNPALFRHALCAIIAGCKKNEQGGIIRLDKNGAKIHKSLKDGKIYPVSSCHVYTCSSSDQSNFYGIVHAGTNGHWYITSHTA